MKILWTIDDMTRWRRIIERGRIISRWFAPPKIATWGQDTKSGDRYWLMQEWFHQDLRKGKNQVKAIIFMDPFLYPLWSLWPNQDRIFDCLCFQSMRWTYRLYHHGTWGCFRKYNEWYCWGCLHHGFKTNDNSKLLQRWFWNARNILMWERLKIYSRLPTKNYKTSCRPITLPVRDWSGGEDELYAISFQFKEILWWWWW